MTDNPTHALTVEFRGVTNPVESTLGGTERSAETRVGFGTRALSLDDSPPAIHSYGISIQTPCRLRILEQQEHNSSVSVRIQESILLRRKVLGRQILISQ